MQRLNSIAKHLAPIDSQGSIKSPTAGKGKSPDDIVIVAAVRTAIGKAKRGGFKDTHPTDLLAPVLKAVVERAGIKPDQVDDIQVGNVLLPGGFATQARMAMFLAGFPEKVPITTCNRQCSSGLQAFANVAGAITSGVYEIGIAAGLESMSKADMMSGVGEINDKIFENKLAAACLNTMGQTSENVAKEYGVSRKKQDEFSVTSHERAVAAQKKGQFKEEILPIKTKVVGDDGKEKEVTVDADEGPREGTNFAGLSKLKPAFAKEGTTTAGNSSQVSDGAAAVLVTTRRKANELKLPILGSFKGYAVAGVRPDVMGIGPAYAIPAALKKAGLTKDDIDIFE
jgi:acetyl-CoA acyltransferase 1